MQEFEMFENFRTQIVTLKTQIVASGLEKVKMINNLYLGFSMRLNRLMSDTRPDNFDNLHIPGFNKKTDENVWGAGFNYTLKYAIPVKL